MADVASLLRSCYKNAQNRTKTHVNIKVELFVVQRVARMLRDALAWHSGQANQAYSRVGNIYRRKHN